MPLLISSIFEDCQLLPHFIRHYLKSGVTDFFFAINRYGNADLFEMAATAIKPFETDAISIHLCAPIYAPQTDMTEEMNKIRLAQVQPSEYIIVADLDEFIEFPNPLPAIVNKCIEQHYLYVRGYLIDRVTSDGSIPKILESDLWSQFPLEGSLSPRLHNARTRKCVLQRGDISISTGHHGPANLDGFHPQSAKVHHFKWFGDLQGRLTRRIAIEQAKGFSYWKESEAVLSHLCKQGGRLDVSLLKNANGH